MDSWTPCGVDDVRAELRYSEFARRVCCSFAQLSIASRRLGRPDEEALDPSLKYSQNHLPCAEGEGRSRASRARTAEGERRVRARRGGRETRVFSRVHV